MATITHTFHSAIADDATAAANGEVLPSHWNASHTVSISAADVGLGNVDNTSDVNKPVSTAQQTALNGKQATLVSATNIKTVNGNTLLGSGDLVVSGGGSPGGSSGAVQGNTASAFAAIPGFTYDTTSGALTVATGTLTASTPAQTITQTWNNAAVVFTGMKFTVTDTASANASTLLELWKGSTPYFAVIKNTPGTAGGGKPGIIVGGGSSGAIATGASFSAGTWNQDACISTQFYFEQSAGFYTQPGNRIGWTAGGISGVQTAMDTALARPQAKVIELNSGTAGAYPGTALLLGIQTVAQLPTAAAGLKGARATVSDATATTFLSTVAGSGANIVPVFCNGTNWLIG